MSSLKVLMEFTWSCWRACSGGRTGGLTLSQSNPDPIKKCVQIASMLFSLIISNSIRNIRLHESWHFSQGDSRLSSLYQINSKFEDNQSINQHSLMVSISS